MRSAPRVADADSSHQVEPTRRRGCGSRGSRPRPRTVTRAVAHAASTLRPAPALRLAPPRCVRAFRPRRFERAAPGAGARATPCNPSHPRASGRSGRRGECPARARVVAHAADRTPMGEAEAPRPPEPWGFTGPPAPTPRAPVAPTEAGRRAMTRAVPMAPRERRAPSAGSDRRTEPATVPDGPLARDASIAGGATAPPQEGKTGRATRRHRGDPPKYATRCHPRPHRLERAVEACTPGRMPWPEAGGSPPARTVPRGSDERFARPGRRRGAGTIWPPSPDAGAADASAPRGTDGTSLRRQPNEAAREGRHPSGVPRSKRCGRGPSTARCDLRR